MIFSGFSKRFLISWQKLWSSWWRRKKLALASTNKGDPGACSWKNVEIWASQSALTFISITSGAKIRVFEQNTDIIKFCLFGKYFPKKNRLQDHVKQAVKFARCQLSLRTLIFLLCHSNCYHCRIIDIKGCMQLS